jgi:hypothetical protein
VKRINILSLVTAMVLALIAVIGASSASATEAEFRADSQEEQVTTLNSERIGENHLLKLGADSMPCGNVSGSGGLFPETARAIYLSTELKGCAVFNQSRSWVTNGCQFHFNAGTGSIGATTAVGTVDITNCKPAMVYTVPGCQMEIGEQTALGTVEYQSTVTEGIGTIRILAKLTGITYTRLNTAGGCAGKSGTFSDGSYTGEWLLKGTNSKGGKVNLEVAATPKLPTTFAAEEAPVNISGLSSSETAQKRITGIGATLNCKVFAFNGTSASTTPTSITLTPEWTGCTFGGEAIANSAITAGGCSIVFDMQGRIEPHEFLEIAGTNCASNPITIARSGCVVTIGPQVLWAGLLVFKNKGSGKSRAVTMTGDTGSAPKYTVEYTASGAKCTKVGSFEGGRFYPGAVLSAAPQGFWVE